MDLLWISDPDLDSAPPLPGELRVDPLLEVRFEVHRCDLEEALERLAGDAPPDAVLFDLAGLEAEAAAVPVHRLGRAARAPVLTAGGGGPRLLLETAAAGAAGHLSAGVPPDDAATAVLLAVERWHVERELRRGYAAFRALHDRLDFGIALATADGRLIDVNRALCTLLGRRRDELVGTSVAALTHEEDQATVELFRELASGRRDQYAVRKRLVGAGGRVVWVDLSASRVDDDAFDEPHVIAEIYDVTRHVTTRHDLDATRQQYRTLFDNNPLPTVVLDVEGFRFVAANRAAVEELGYAREELLELDPNVLLSNGDAGGQAVRELLGEERELGPVRIRLRHRDGQPLQGELHTASIDYGGRRARLLLLRDIGEEVRREEALSRAWGAVAVHEATGDLGRTLGGLVERLEGHLARLRAALPAGSPQAREAAAAGRAVRDVEALRARLAALAAADRPEPRAAAPGAAAVLLVDDDAAVRFVMREMLEEAGHRVVPCASGEEALEAMAEAGPFDLVIADATLPGLRGAELLDRLRRSAPRLRTLFVSGYLDETLTARGVLGKEVPFLGKPFSAAELRAKVDEVLGHGG